MAERPTEDQTFLKFNGPRRSAKPSQEHKKEDGIMEELRSVPANWSHLVMLVQHVIEGMRMSADDGSGGPSRYATFTQSPLNGNWRERSPLAVW